MHVFNKLSLSLTRLPLAALLAGGVLTYLAASPANAQIRTFDLTYSGARFSNSATGTGTITLDLSKLTSYGFTLQSQSPFVTDFSLTITGASSGNGTFTFTDYTGGVAGGFYLDTALGSLDFSKELIGQPTFGAPFGSPGGAGGNFNIFSNFTNLSAPRGDGYFTIDTNGFRGDQLYLTSFRPTAVTAAAVPEPSEYAALGAAGLSLCGLMVQAKRKAVKK